MAAALNRRDVLETVIALAASRFFGRSPAAQAAAAARPRAASTAPSFRTDDSTLQNRYETALAGLAQNVGYVFHYPHPVLKEGARYSGIWLESGPYEGLLYTPFDPAIATASHQVFFDSQRDDGYLPCCVRTNRIESSQIQMVVPIAATALELSRELQDEPFLAAAYRACSAWDDWLVRYRNTRGTGLCEAFCGYDTGEDNSARFKGLPWKCPNDDARVCPKIDALPYLAPDLSATVYGGRVALAQMAKVLGKRAEASRWEEKAEAIRQGIMKWCFDPNDVCFYDRNANNDFVRIRCVELIVVLGERVVDRPLFEEIYRRHIRNPNEFWTPFPFPSIAADDPAFNHSLPANCWGGPSQALTALRAPRWLEYYGKLADLTTLMRRWVQAITRSAGFQQQVNPWTGAFSTGSAYSPAMLVLVDFVARLFGIHGEGAALQWNCRLPDGAAQSSFSLPTARGFAELSVRRANDSVRSVLEFAGERRLTVQGSVRVSTDANGVPLSLAGTEPVSVQVVLTWPEGRVVRHKVSPDERIKL